MVKSTFIFCLFYSQIILAFQIKSVDCYGINFYVKLSTCSDKLFFRIYFDNKVNNLFDIEDELKKIDI